MAYHNCLYILLLLRSEFSQACMFKYIDIYWEVEKSSKKTWFNFSYFIYFLVMDMSFKFLYRNFFKKKC